ncbi:hypothetical protein [Stenotrophomonas sp. SrG]|uniref:hypothetical protein n=1 Tax=Stenotrophomonas sp. SrG TaxID=3414430 RepID=UPI003CE8AB45
MYGTVKAIAIDDEPSHLLAITTALGALGLPAIGHWYDRENSELQPSPPAGGYGHLRLVFTDLNLAELGGVANTESLWGTIVSVLKQVISPDSGPYLLVFWTRMEATAASVKTLLYDRPERLNGAPLPLDVMEIPKGPFLVRPVDGGDFEDQLKSYYSELHSKMAELKQLIAQTIVGDKRVHMLAAWEARAAEAASRAVNEVSRCARIDVDNDPVRASESIAVTLSRIAVAAAGANGAKKHPARALDAGLLDIVADQFSASVVDGAYQAAVADAIGEQIEGDAAFSKPLQMSAELNTFFHVDRVLEHLGSLDRGAVLFVKSMDRNVLGGFRPMKYLTSEFFFPADMVSADNLDQHRADITEIRDSKSAVLVELGADCDHAQDNQRTSRFLLGFCVPERFMYIIRSNDRLRSGALELLGPWVIDGESKYLLVSCRRFWTWQDSVLGGSEIAFRLRASVVEKLLHRYSSWASRPGIIEFR